MSEENKDAKDLIKELEQKRKDALAKIENQLEEANKLYDGLTQRLELYSEDDRKRCEQVYGKMISIVEAIQLQVAGGGRFSPGALDALNAATKNMLDSTQRLRELLQEVGKTKVKLEEIHSMMNNIDDNEGEEKEFNPADHIG